MIFCYDCRLRHSDLSDRAQRPHWTFSCALVWSIALIGIFLKVCWINCPKWFSSALYITMGDGVRVLAFTQIRNSLPPAAFGWPACHYLLQAGVIHALKLPIFNARHKNFGSHEIFHLFVMGGSACHLFMMYRFVAAMPI